MENIHAKWGKYTDLNVNISKCKYKYTYFSEYYIRCSCQVFRGITVSRIQERLF